MKLILDLRENDNSFVKLNKDAINVIKSKCNFLVKSLFDNSYIDEATRIMLTCYNGTTTKFYSLLIHKTTLFVRPIVTSINIST